MEKAAANAVAVAVSAASAAETELRKACIHPQITPHWDNLKKGDLEKVSRRMSVALWLRIAALYHDTQMTYTSLHPASPSTLHAVCENATFGDGALG